MSSVFFILFIFVIVYVIKKASSSSSYSYFNERKVRMYFSNVEKVFTSSTIALYKGDKSGENFLIAIKLTYSPISNLDLSTIYDVSVKYHIHNKILLSNEDISSNQLLSKKLKEYEIRVIGAYEFQNLMNGSSSVLETSNTSDDNCHIDEANNPIKFVEPKFNIFSILKSKQDK